MWFPSYSYGVPLRRPSGRWSSAINPLVPKYSCISLFYFILFYLFKFMVSGFFSYSVRKWVYLSQYVRQLRGHSTSVVVFHLHTILSLRRIRRFVDAL